MAEAVMARPLRIEYPGAFYHVTSRGKGTAWGQTNCPKPKIEANSEEPREGSGLHS
jgi:hypothetical protein